MRCFCVGFFSPQNRPPISPTQKTPSDFKKRPKYVYKTTAAPKGCVFEIAVCFMLSVL